MISTEQDYVKVITQGDMPGLKQIYQKFLPRISRLITSKGGTREDAKDVFQDAIVLIFEKAEQGKLQLTSNFYTLLAGICRKLWANRLRKKSGNEVTFSGDETFINQMVQEEDVTKVEQGQVFWAAFKKLGADCRKIMQMYFEKKSMEEITKKMGFKSVSYSKKRKFQCKEKLVQLVKKDQRYQELALR